MPRPNNVSKSELLQEMLNSYNAMSIMAMNDFADDYDLRLDGIENTPPAELSEYVDQLLDFRTEAMNGSLNQEEKGLYDNLINKLKEEPEMTSIHKMLQYSMMSALLDSGAALEGDSFQKAVDCQNLYRLIASESLHKSMQEQVEYNLDGGDLRKSAIRTVEDLLAKEQQLDAHPLTDICRSVMRNQNDRDVHLLFTSDFLSPYMKSLKSDLRLDDQGSAMREEDEPDKSMNAEALALATSEQQRLEKSIADLDRQTEDLKQKLDIAQKKFDVYCRRNEFPQDPEEQNPYVQKRENVLAAEKAGCVDYINDRTDRIDRSARVMENNMGAEAERSAEFRSMKKALAPLRQSYKTSFEERYEDVQKALAETEKYIRRREAGSYWSRHFGESGKRYKEAVETKKLLENCCEHCKNRYLDPQAVLDKFKTLRDEKKSATRQLWDTENRLSELRGNISGMEKAEKKLLSYSRLKEKMNQVDMPEKHRNKAEANVNVAKRHSRSNAIG